MIVSYREKYTLGKIEVEYLKSNLPFGKQMFYVSEYLCSVRLEEGEFVTEIPFGNKVRIEDILNGHR